MHGVPFFLIVFLSRALVALVHLPFFFYIYLFVRFDACGPQTGKEIVPLLHVLFSSYVLFVYFHLYIFSFVRFDVCGPQTGKENAPVNHLPFSLHASLFFRSFDSMSMGKEIRCSSTFCSHYTI